MIATTLSAYLAVGLVYNDISSHDIAECRIDRTIVEDSVAAAMDPARFYLNRDQLQFANFYVETVTVLDPKFSQNERCFTSIQIHVAIFVEPKDPRLLTTQITPWARHGVVLSEKSSHLNALIREIQSQVENFAELWRAQQ